MLSWPLDERRQASVTANVRLHAGWSLHRSGVCPNRLRMKDFVEGFELEDPAQRPSVGARACGARTEAELAAQGAGSTYSSMRTPPWDRERCGDYPLTVSNMRARLSEGYHFLECWAHGNKHTWAPVDEEMGTPPSSTAACPAAFQGGPGCLPRTAGVRFLNMLTIMLSMWLPVLEKCTPAI